MKPAAANDRGLQRPPDAGSSTAHSDVVERPAVERSVVDRSGVDRSQVDTRRVSPEPIARRPKPTVVGQPKAELPSHDGKLFAWLIAGYPLAWALGFGPLIYAALALPMAGWILRNRPVRVLPGTILFALFTVIVLVSGLGLESPGAAVFFLLRFSWYAAGLIAFVYLAAHRGPESGVRLVRAMVWLWMAVVFGGYLSIFLPELSWTTPVGLLAPQSVLENDFLNRLIIPQVSEIQVFRFQDVTLYRPAAPFAYTNAWGASMALLTPFVIAAIHERRVGIPRLFLVPMLAAGMVPLAVALNRGSWLTLGLGILYGVIRWAWVRHDHRPLIALIIATLVGAVFAMATGLFSSSVDQLNTRSEDSNETRSGLYVETFLAMDESPLIGFGTTRPSVDNPKGPPLGTHGQLWAVMFAHGFVGLALYVGFFGYLLVRARSAHPIQHWAKISLLIGLMQLPIYGHLPHQLFIMIGAGVMANWIGRPPPIGQAA